jgi:hypothetical protein
VHRVIGSVAARPTASRARRMAPAVRRAAASPRARAGRGAPDPASLCRSHSGAFRAPSTKASQ